MRAPQLSSRLAWKAAVWLFYETFDCSQPSRRSPRWGDQFKADSSWRVSRRLSHSCKVMRHPPKKDSGKANFDPTSIKPAYGQQLCSMCRWKAGKAAAGKVCAAVYIPAEATPAPSQQLIGGGCAAAGMAGPQGTRPPPSSGRW